MTQFELFGARPEQSRLNRRGTDQAAKAKLKRVLRSAATGGLVNGMSKAQLRRYAPAKLPRVTVDD